MLLIGYILIILGLLNIIIKYNNYIIILLSLELILIGISILFISYSLSFDDLSGLAISFYIFIIAATESAIGLTILLISNKPNF